MSLVFANVQSQLPNTTPQSKMRLKSFPDFKVLGVLGIFQIDFIATIIIAAGMLKLKFAMNGYSRKSILHSQFNLIVSAANEATKQVLRLNQN